ncbi:GNAT family N-acetyltransferase [Nannocystis bainbridge]|uniref:GNAT family N-acetyltransferase n=1 Tax=Nannocystis bainbridge TaxID=2995303 RepID=A0ABT5DXJ5_9BACT|nr:GNAT family N-acetyltransferase [Nannocystis bainbridge]MDC0718347.1 GNAT family N-acetyltransferase [Nannocystis bainbridge]
MSPTLRLATLDDIPALRELIAASARGLQREDYSPAQIEAALGSAFGVDTQLIADRTYFVAEAEGAPVACGGWSFRRTLFGGDDQPGREAERLDPKREAARIRAFFVDPGWARRGLGRAILTRCEDEARAAGFHRVELMATLPGVRLYAALGYEGTAPLEVPLRDGLTITFVPMSKAI